MSQYSFEPYLSKFEEIEREKLKFFQVENKCFRQKNVECIAEHDSYKLTLTEVLRRKKKELLLLEKQCSHFLGKEPPPEGIEYLRQHRACTKPFLKNYHKLLDTELQIIKEANEELSTLTLIFK